MQWLVASVVLSVVLTVVLNVVVRLFPNQSEQAARRLEEHMTRDRDDDRHARVIVPWKAMLIGSLVLTIAINVLLRL